LVQGEQGLWSVYVAAGESAAEAEVARQPVEIVHTEGNRVLVQGLVAAGDRVITAGTHRVVPGQACQPHWEGRWVGWGPVQG
jgi:multidrug efflux pump subunit AcrA (membrane-fusion protein)